jgi:ketosteroid isomerase-like protein
MADSTELQTVADKQAIRELIYTYCRAVDRLDIPLGHSIWHDDGYADYGADYYQGPGKGVIDTICQHHTQLLSHSHQVTNILIELDGDKAGSEAYVYGTMRLMQDGRLMHLGIWARYLDAWERRGGRWGLVRRMVVYDHEEIREARAMGQAIRSTRDASDPSYQFLQGRKWGDG